MSVLNMTCTNNKTYIIVSKFICLLNRWIVSKRITRNLLNDQQANKSLFILRITGPCSYVRTSLTRAWWLSATGYVADTEPPPGRGGRQWIGSLPRHSAGGGYQSHTATARSPGRQPFWPTLSHPLHPMALQWPERDLSKTKQKQINEPSGGQQYMYVHSQM